ncbi:MAG: class I SAM-dependent methyltransferase [Lachnospira sp.]
MLAKLYLISDVEQEEILIALAGEGYSVIAIDCAEEAVEMVRRKAKDKNYNIKCLVNSNECQVPVENKSIDAIIADGSLFYKDFKRDN